MIQFNVKLSNLLLDKLDSALKNATGIALRLSPNIIAQRAGTGGAGENVFHINYY